MISATFHALHVVFPAQAGLIPRYVWKGWLTEVFTAQSDWALEAARWNTGSELVVGSNGYLYPLDNITRAETATIVLKLLQKAGLVDVRRPQVVSD